MTNKLTCMDFLPARSGGRLGLAEHCNTNGKAKCEEFSSTPAQAPKTKATDGVNHRSTVNPALSQG